MNLQEYIVFCERNFQDKPLVIWDTNLTCVFASECYVRSVKVDGEIIGKKMSEISDEFASFHEQFKSKITDRVFKYRRPLLAYYFYPKNSVDDYVLMCAQVSPLFGTNPDQLIGVMTEIMPLINYAPYLKLSISLRGNPQLVNNKPPQINLTRREKIILFLAIFGMSHKQIANILSEVFGKLISVNSISSLISRQLYPKLNVWDQYAMTWSAINMGILYDIPFELIKHLPRILMVVDFIDYTKSIEAQLK